MDELILKDEVNNLKFSSDIDGDFVIHAENDYSSQTYYLCKENFELLVKFVNQLKLECR